MLWIFALMIAVGTGNTGGGGGSGSTNISSETDSNGSDNGQNVQDFQNYLERKSLDQGVLGIVAQRLPDKQPNKFPIPNSFNESGIDKFIPQILITTLALFLFILYAIALAFIVRNWALVSLIEGTVRGIKSTEKLNIKELAKVGIDKVIPMIKMKLILFIVFVPVVLILLTLPVVAAIGGSDSLGILVLIVSLLFLVLLSILVSLTKHFASRLIVFDGEGAKESIGHGFKLVNSNLGKSFSLLIINVIVSLGLTIAAFIAAVILLLLIVTIPVALVLMSVVSGYLTTFRSFTWTNLFLFANGSKETHKTPDLSAGGVDAV